MLAPLYTAEEMKAAEAGHDVPALMNRAGTAVAEEALRRFPEARTFVLHAGSGANGGDGKIAARLLEERGVRHLGRDRLREQLERLDLLRTEGVRSG